MTGEDEKNHYQVFHPLKIKYSKMLDILLGVRHKEMYKTNAPSLMEFKL